MAAACSNLAAARGSILLYESAINPPSNKGCASVDHQTTVGLRFTLTETWIVDAVGGNFYGYGDGNIIAGILSLPGALADLPAPLDLIPADFLASALFSPPEDVADVSVSFSSPLTLPPGQYALLFSGLANLGATGGAVLNDSHTDLGAPSRFGSIDDQWMTRIVPRRVF